MANTKSAIRAARRSLRRRVVNLKTSEKYKKTLRSFRKLITAAKMDEAVKAMASAMSSLDKAVKKRLIHSNKAARLKSRMAKALKKNKTS